MLKSILVAALTAFSLVSSAIAQQSTGVGALTTLDALPEDAQQQLLCAVTYQARSEVLLHDMRRQLQTPAPSLLSDLRTPPGVHPELAEQFITAGTYQELLRQVFVAEQGKLFPAEVYDGALTEIRAAFTGETADDLMERQSVLESCQAYLDNLVRVRTARDAAKMTKVQQTAEEFGKRRYAAVLAEKVKR